MAGTTRIAMGSFVLVATTLLCALLAELLLRAIGLSYPTFGQADPLTGSWHRPFAEGTYRQEGVAWVSINRYGMRDRDHRDARGLQQGGR